MTAAGVPAVSIPRRLAAIAAMRCPRCCRGAVYSGPLRMRGACPSCNLEFEREPGYFTGAMYVSYTLGIITTAPLYFLFLYLGVDPGLIIAITAVQLFVCIPLFFRYSRVLWMYLDMGFNPPEDPTLATVHEGPEKGTVRTLRN